MRRDERIQREIQTDDTRKSDTKYTFLSYTFAIQDWTFFVLFEQKYCLVMREIGIIGKREHWFKTQEEIEVKDHL
jgi:hypothetical protein